MSVEIDKQRQEIRAILRRFLFMEQIEEELLYQINKPVGKYLLAPSGEARVAQGAVRVRELSVAQKIENDFICFHWRGSLQVKLTCYCSIGLHHCIYY